MDSLYSWHLLLTGIGFHLIMPIGISSLRVQQLLPCWSCSRKTVHWLLQSVASACVLIGVVLQYINREMKHKHHFTTVHSIVGLLSVVLVVVSLVGGVVALSGWEVRKLVSTVWLYRVHRAVGTAAFLAGMVTLALAYEKRNFKKSFSKETRFALTIATGIAVVITLLGVFKKFTSF
uniref:ascorbate ferrireductase (transmembrane) n=1 Tax=Anopheles christyi TaxID=43041 RepID=A0A182K4X8_9DIPT